jgi:hypothetical protein
MADEISTSSLKGSATAPSGLLALVAEEYDSNDNFCWDGDESGVDFDVSSALTKSYNNIAFTTLHASMLWSRLHLLPWPLLHFVVPTGKSISWRLFPPNALSYLNILCVDYSTYVSCIDSSYVRPSFYHGRFLCYQLHNP